MGPEELRVTLWPVVNWVIPIRLHPATGSGDVDYLALRPQLLPRVPIAGERLSLNRHYAVVDHVSWGEDGRVVVSLEEQTVRADYLELLQEAGWTVFPRHDADEWFGGGAMPGNATD